VGRPHVPSLKKGENYITRNSTSESIRIIESKRDEMTDTGSSCGDMRNAWIIPVLISQGKKPLERHKSRWEDNTVMDIR
jgi:hypothetical protein